MTHAPGPWHVTNYPYAIDVDCATYTVACDVNNEHDARLVAAAPDLLHALEMVRDANKDEPHIPPIALATIEAAIAKATGG